MNRPLLIYDGDCGFCRRHVARWKSIAGSAVDFEPYQDAGARFPDIPQDAFRTSVLFVRPDGSVVSGATAVFEVLAHNPSSAWMLRVYRAFPPFAWITEALYALVARNRGLASLLDGWFVGYDAPVFGSWRVARFLFLRGLAIIYGIAFASLGTQILGLSGSRGILPAAEVLDAVRRQRGVIGHFEWPSLFWLWPSDAGLLALAWGGAALAAAAAAGLWPRAAFLGLWAFYLSLVSIGGDFMRFQWDFLLLEAGFLAIGFAPGGFWWTTPGGARTPPSPVFRWLLWWLLFRLMFLSGAVKLLSHDKVWLNLTALSVHYETQPLPTVFSWFAHHLPLWAQRASCAAMFAVELAVPFLIFGPRRARHAAGFALIGLQLLITATGNYCFFNLLTIALCLTLFDDGFWRRGQEAPAAAPRDAASRAQRALTGVFAVALVVFSLLASGARLGAWRWPEPALKAYAWVQAYGITSVYGLFADMTEERNEIVLEGSWDGVTWEEIGFKFKPQALDRAPRWAAPHQPRADWQMWFAALGTWRQNHWFVRFVQRILQGSPEAAGLLARSPHAEPPLLVRALSYRYRFTTPAARRETGRWWSREHRGMYLPPVRLEDFEEIR